MPRRGDRFGFHRLAGGAGESLLAVFLTGRLLRDLAFIPGVGGGLDMGRIVPADALVRFFVCLFPSAPGVSGRVDRFGFRGAAVFAGKGRFSGFFAGRCFRDRALIPDVVADGDGIRRVRAAVPGFLNGDHKRKRPFLCRLAGDFAGLRLQLQGVRQLAGEHLPGERAAVSRRRLDRRAVACAEAGVFQRSGVDLRRLRHGRAGDGDDVCAVEGMQLHHDAKNVRSGLKRIARKILDPAGAFVGICCSAEVRNAVFPQLVFVGSVRLHQQDTDPLIRIKLAVAVRLNVH